MSVKSVNTTVIKCVTISQAATNALVEMDIHSYLITEHVKVRKRKSLFLFFLTQRHKIRTSQVNSALDIQVNILHDIDTQSTKCCQRCIAASNDRSTKVRHHLKRRTCMDSVTQSEIALMSMNVLSLSHCPYISTWNKTIGSYQFLCKGGYTHVNEGTCDEDIDECDSGQTNCIDNMLCVNTPGT